ncbi:pseudouridine synthase [Oceanicoccus sagamiensis]|uniref:Dual-specificity RNA pseudouridine synthase RluA n=1 Tax=Oceanicoccus sagamiensis TaxID=716816 RepID=A0A1X9N656_9GAMM|nr:pseudouridine synthase [Oceanicoccus sagamiensis]ARN73206.1 RNA pseudouridine synthase [Oceanicoccus sagamiensis]
MSDTEVAKPFIVPPCLEPVTIIHADKDLLLVNKPSGLLSVPGKHPANKDCLISRLQVTYPEARIVHRLDMDTSGIMVVALNADCHRALNRLFSEREVSKAYEAKVFGLLAKDAGVIELPLICDWPNRPKQKVDFEQGKKASTHYEVISRDNKNNSTHILLTPITGRSHQLRVHMAELGHAILGCDFYAHPEALAMAERLLLHATRLAFVHPVSGEIIKGYSPCEF